MDGLVPGSIATGMSVMVPELSTVTGLPSAANGSPAVAAQYGGPNDGTFLTAFQASSGVYELRVYNLDVPPNCTVDSPTMCTRWDVNFIGSKSGPALDVDMRI
ncbi:MAG TPA: hypothetical protein VGX23_19355 [Actinocrinis sp.]|nr:hypothetical protein [Actinocrinis sp.]